MLIRVRKLITVLSLVFSATVSASGWLDYELDIGDGYHIFRASSLEVSLTRNHEVIVSSDYYREIGPINGYVKSPTYIFLRTTGRKPGDQFQEIDATKAFYFVVHVDSTKVEGPLSADNFRRHPSVVAAGTFAWLKPQNPHFWRPLLGMLFFVLVSPPILYAKYWFVTVPLTGIAIYWFVLRRRRGYRPT